MPTYQYTCTACGEDLEAVQRFSDDALTECPACGGRLRKVFGSVGVVFKGSGFYKTDSRTSAGKTAAVPAEKKEPARSGADAGSSSDSGSGSAGSGGEKSGSTTTSSTSDAGGKSSSSTGSSSGSGAAA